MPEFQQNSGIDRIKEERPNATYDVIELDLARLQSVKKFATSNSMYL
jgi:hypothetical protein